MLVKASVGISNHLRGIEWELAEIVFLNQFRVDITSAGSGIKEGSDQESLLVVWSDAFDLQFRELRGTKEVHCRHVGDTVRRGSKGWVGKERLYWVA